MTTIEERYNKIIDDVSDAFEREDVEAFITANKEIAALYPIWCKEAPVAVFSASNISNKEMMKSLKECVPLIKTLPNGNFLVLLHGTKDGEFVVGPNTIVRYNDNRFTDLFPVGAEVEVISCYPGSRPNQWKHNGRHFHNVGDCDVKSLLAAGYDFWTDKIYVRPVSKRHAEFVETKLSVPSQFLTKLAAASL